MKLPFLLALALLSTGCASLTGSKPEIKSVVPRVTGLDLEGVTLAFDVGVKNPYFVPIRAPKMRYAFSVEGNPFLNEETIDDINIPASGLGNVTLPVRVTYADLVRTYQTLAGLNEASYKLDGAFLFSALGESVSVPLSYGGKFPVLKAPTVSVVKLQPGEFSWNKATLAVDATISNPNVFKIALDGLGYDLKLGDLTVATLKASTPQEIGAGKAGAVSLSGETSAMDAMRQLFKGDSLGRLRIAPTGAFNTPFGEVKLK